MSLSRQTAVAGHLARRGSSSRERGSVSDQHGQMPSLPHSKGFTLLELLCGLAVVGILATLAIPLAGNYRARAHALKCQSNLKGLGAGASAFLDDHNDCWPQIDLPKTPGEDSDSGKSMETSAETWITTLSKYGVAESSWRCPTIENKIAADGAKGALEKKRLDYVPTQFSADPGIARKWPNHPWFIERTPNHGLGPRILLTSGRVVSLEDLLKELP